MRFVKTERKLFAFSGTLFSSPRFQAVAFKLPLSKCALLKEADEQADEHIDERHRNTDEKHRDGEMLPKNRRLWRLPNASAIHSQLHTSEGRETEKASAERQETKRERRIHTLIKKSFLELYSPETNNSGRRIFDLFYIPLLSMFRQFYGTSVRPN